MWRNHQSETSPPGKVVGPTADRVKCHVREHWRQLEAGGTSGGDRLLYVGIDWAEKAHRVCIRDDERIQAELEVPNSAEGAAELLMKVAGIEPDKRKVLFGIEANHGPFVDAILDAGYTVYPLNPKAVERYRDRFRWLDARTDRHAYQPLRPDGERTTMLRLLTRDCQTMLRNQLRSALLAYFPLAVELFSDEATSEALEPLLRAYRCPKAEVKARELHRALQRPSFPVRPAVAAAKGMLVAVLVAQLEALNAQISQYRKEIDALTKEHP